MCTIVRLQRILSVILSSSLFIGLQACSGGSSAQSGAGVVPTAASSVHTASQCQPDFSFSLSSSSAMITAGQTVLVGFGMTSLCGLAGTINVGVRGISPQPGEVCTGHGSKQTCTTNGPTVQQCCYDFPLRAAGSTGNHITFGATANTVKTTYTITIKAEDISGGCCYGLTHVATFTLTVT